ncbi:MAG: hypothetical protein JWR22_1311 [Herminiimonas sp.]|nr:hypothetical protein [Herminiimonas sp.]
MFKVYPGNEIADLYGTLGIAEDLCSVASRLKALITDGIAKSPADVYKVNLAKLGDDEAMLDFRWSSPLGQVYSRFGLVKYGSKLLGQYTFYAEERDPQNCLTRKPVFAFLFRSDGYCRMGGTADAARMNEGFERADGDFVWYLAGNVTHALLDNLDTIPLALKSV